MSQKTEKVASKGTNAASPTHHPFSPPHLKAGVQNSLITPGDGKGRRKGSSEMLHYPPPSTADTVQERSRRNTKDTMVQRTASMGVSQSGLSSTGAREFFPALSRLLWRREQGEKGLRGRFFFTRANFTTGTSFQHPLILGEAALTLRKGSTWLCLCGCMWSNHSRKASP